MSISKVPSNSFWTVTPLLGQSSCIDRQNPLSKNIDLPVPKIGLHILNIKLAVFPDSWYPF